MIHDILLAIVLYLVLVLSSDLSHAAVAGSAGGCGQPLCGLVRRCTRETAALHVIPARVKYHDLVNKSVLVCVVCSTHLLRAKGGLYSTKFINLGNTSRSERHTLNLMNAWTLDTNCYITQMYELCIQEILCTCTAGNNVIIIHH